MKFTDIPAQTAGTRVRRPQMKHRRWADLLKVLAHPTRLALADVLVEGTCCVSDACDLLHVPQPNLSQHLSILRKAGIVDFQEDGKRRCYFLCDPESIKKLIASMESIQL